MIILLFGAPGSGKGTQSRLLKDRFGFSFVVAGDLVRSNVEGDPILQKQVAGGFLISPEMVFNWVNVEIGKFLSEDRDVIIDGFPRSLEQVRMLERFLVSVGKSVNYVFFLKVSEDVIRERTLGRIVCLDCNCSLPKGSIVCLQCVSTNLIKRQDDNQEAVKNRVKTFYEMSVPVLDFYKDKVVTFDGEKSPEGVFDDIQGFLKGDIV